MKSRQRLLGLALILALSFTATAQQVYKRVNEDGTIEFSDTPSPDADKIDVKPNVVETNPIQPQAREAATTEAEPAPEPVPSDEPETVEPVEQVWLEEEAYRDVAVDPKPGRALRKAAGPR